MPVTTPSPRSQGKHHHTAISILTAALSCLIVGESVTAQCTYEIVAVIEGPQICGIQGNYPADVYPQGMNDKMEVVGYYSCLVGDNLPFLWTPDGGFQSLPVPPGYSIVTPHDISNTGAICGTLGYTIRGFVYEDDVYTIIEPPAGGNFTEALALNEAGQVTGFWGNNGTGPGRVAYFWDDGVLTSLAKHLGKPASVGYFISESGSVTGWAGTVWHQDARAFIWSTGNVELLPPVPGGYTSEALATTDCGTAVGGGIATDSEGEAAVYALRHEDGAFNVIIAPAGLQYVGMKAVNRNEVAVGRAWDEVLPGFAILWTGDLWYDLNLLIPPQTFTLRRGMEITDSGIILCEALAGGRSIGVILRPLFQSAAELTGDCRVDFSDFTYLLASWGNSCTSADIDQDGEVGFTDFTILLSEWTVEP